LENESRKKEKLMNQETFGQRFVRLRKGKGLTQEAVATALKVSPQAVSKWETDSSLPDISLLTGIAELFGVTTDTLLGKEEEHVQIVPNPTPEEIDKKMLKIRIVSGDGDIVKVNLPMGLVRIMTKSSQGVEISGMDSLKGIDWKAIMDMVDKGIIGDLVDITSADGDTVSIAVQ
jgi:Predicted transcriptional regulators